MHIKMMYNIATFFKEMYSTIKWQSSTTQKSQLFLHQPNNQLKL